MGTPLVAFLIYLTFTGLFTLLFVMGLMRTSSKEWPERTDILSDEERARWQEIERHWR
jgi:hypothetical protein